jgi:hypothetical protein
VPIYKNIYWAPHLSTQLSATKSISLHEFSLERWHSLGGGGGVRSAIFRFFLSRNTITCTKIWMQKSNKYCSSYIKRHFLTSERYNRHMEHTCCRIFVCSKKIIYLWSQLCCKNISFIISFDLFVSAASEKRGVGKEWTWQNPKGFDFNEMPFSYRFQHVYKIMA